METFLFLAESYLVSPKNILVLSRIVISNTFHHKETKDMKN